MEMIQIVGIGVIAAVLAIVVREQKPIFAFMLASFAGLFILLFVIGKVEAVIRVIEDLANKSGIPSVYLKTILKIIGIAYITEFGAQIVKDAGQDSIAAKIEFAGKVFILVLAIPIISVIIETIVGLLPGGGG